MIRALIDFEEPTPPVVSGQAARTAVAAALRAAPGRWALLGAVGTISAATQTSYAIRRGLSGWQMFGAGYEAATHTMFGEHRVYVRRAAPTAKPAAAEQRSEPRPDAEPDQEQAAALGEMYDAARAAGLTRAEADDAFAAAHQTTPEQATPAQLRAQRDDLLDAASLFAAAAVGAWAVGERLADLLDHHRATPRHRR